MRTISTRFHAAVSISRDLQPSQATLFESNHHPLQSRFMRFSALFLCSLGLLAAPPNVQVPRPAPELSIKMLDGRQVLLSAHRGKVVAVEFLYTTCVHCQRASVVINRLQKEYDPRGFQALGVAFNDNAALLLPDFLKEFRLDYPVGLGTFTTLFDFLGVPPQNVSLPQLIFVDRKGVMRKYVSGEDPFFQDEEKNMREQIEALLKEPSPSRSRPQ